MMGLYNALSQPAGDEFTVAGSYTVFHRNATVQKVEIQPKCVNIDLIKEQFSCSHCLRISVKSAFSSLFLFHSYSCQIIKQTYFKYLGF